MTHWRRNLTNRDLILSRVGRVTEARDAPMSLKKQNSSFLETLSSLLKLTLTIFRVFKFWEKITTRVEIVFMYFYYCCVFISLYFVSLYFVFLYECFDELKIRSVVHQHTHRRAQILKTFDCSNSKLYCLHLQQQQPLDVWKSFQLISFSECNTKFVIDFLQPKLLQRVQFAWHTLDLIKEIMLQKIILALRGG